jgi:serine protease SohB
MFLAKTLTVVMAILAVITMMVAAGQRRRNVPRGNISVTHLNRELESLKDSLNAWFWINLPSRSI